MCSTYCVTVSDVFVLYYYAYSMHVLYTVYIEYFCNEVYICNDYTCTCSVYRTVYIEYYYNEVYVMITHVP